jgi:flagellin-specific chaperone FliS
MNDEQNQIFTILYELCQSLIFSLEMNLDNHEKFVEVIDKLTPIISRTSLSEYFEKTKKSIVESTKEDRESIQESIKFLETMRKRWEDATNKKIDITYN